MRQIEFITELIKQFELLNSLKWAQHNFMMLQESTVWMIYSEHKHGWMEGWGGWLMMGGQDYFPLIKGFGESFSPYVLDDSSAVMWTHTPAQLFPWSAAEYFVKKGDRYFF